MAMRHSWPDAYARVVAILQQLGAGGFMLTPTEQDMSGPIEPLMDKYFQGANIAAKDRVRLFRLAWDLIGTQFGARSTLYERYFNGDVVRHRQVRFATYDYTRSKRSYDDFMAAMDDVE
jgi:4-hydroxyphenylacetate 3-monooxygenase